MPNRPHPTRSHLNPSPVLHRPRRPRPRPWPALTLQARTQLAQQVARLIQRLRPAGEAPHADRAE